MGLMTLKAMLTMNMRQNTLEHSIVLSLAMTSSKCMNFLHSWGKDWVRWKCLNVLVIIK